MNSPVFTLLENDEKQQVIEFMYNNMVQIPKGCTLTHRGEKVDALYFVLSGELELSPGPDDDDEEEEEDLVETGDQRDKETDGSTDERTEGKTSTTQGEDEGGDGQRKRSGKRRGRVLIRLPAGSFVLPRAFVRTACTGHRVIALKHCSLYKLTSQSFHSITNGTYVCL